MTEYRKLPDSKLVELLFTAEDRLPRAVIDEFVQRGGLVSRLDRIVSDPYNWNEPLPEWWAVVHAVYILGAVATPDTVLPLLRSLRYAEACENDWVTEDLPAIFGKVGIAAESGLRAIASDRTNGWYARALGLEGLAAIALSSRDSEAGTFRFICTVLADRGEEWPLRQTAGHILLDLKRSECRGDLETFGREERLRSDKDPSSKPAFIDSDVELEFREGTLNLERYTADWLAFYTPEAEEARQTQREAEQRTHADSPDHAPANELCPFAAGQKRKKCCMGRAGIA